MINTLANITGVVCIILLLLLIALFFMGKLSARLLVLAGITLSVVPAAANALAGDLFNTVTWGTAAVAWFGSLCIHKMAAQRSTER